MPKGWISLQRLPLLCNGLINHSQRLQQLTWFFPTVKQNPDIIISLLHKHLYNSFVANKTPRAPTLYLQADNCYKENKNQYTLFYLALLIAWGWFDDVYMSFLPTGHTHEDIDRLFSYLRIILKRDEYNTLIALMNKIML